MALQRGSALARILGKEGCRRNQTQPVNPSCVVMATTLGTKRCLPGSFPAQQREKGYLRLNLQPGIAAVTGRFGIIWLRGGLQSPLEFL